MRKLIGRLMVVMAFGWAASVTAAVPAHAKMADRMIHKSTFLLAFMLLMLFTLGSAKAAGAVVFSQPIVDREPSYGAFEAELADNFVLADSAEIVAIRFWNSSALTSGFSARFYADTGSGEPQNTPFASFSGLNGTSVATSFLTFPGVPVFDHEFALPSPVALQGGDTYYLSIGHENSPFTVLWSGAGRESHWIRGGIFPTWTNNPLNPHNLAFELEAVPIPAAAWLFGSALLGLAAVKRKKA